MTKRTFIVLLLMFLMGRSAWGQFYSYGDDPGGLKWYHVTTGHFDVIYPEGLDSLARVYAGTLEKVRKPVSATIGYEPNCNYKKPLPVVLHPYSVLSNGMVSWAPRRMELITTPDAYDVLPMPWEEQLAVHESRHVAQMQFAEDRPYRPFNWLIGELFPGAMCAIYPGPSFMEGDAVVVETELSHSGRGRSATFLEYYRSCFGTGDFRDYWRWRYGSLRRYTPDYYTIGYITMTGMRTVYDCPDFTAKYYERIFRHRNWPWPMFNFQNTVREISGKPFRDAFREICDSLASDWRRDELSRAPFMPMIPVRPAPGRYTDFSSNSFLDGHVYDVKSSINSTAELVRTSSDGTQTRIGAFSSGASGVKPDEVMKRLYWSEPVPDPRWSLRSFSEIHYMDSTGRYHALTRKTRLFNPTPSPDSPVVSATEYPEKGGSALVIVNAFDGTPVDRIPAPDGMQIVESEWLGGGVFVSAVTKDGIGIYKATEGFKPLVEAQRASIRELWHHRGKMYFTSDRSGVDELYSIDIDGGTPRQITATPYGASEFQWNEAEDTLIYSAITPQGRLLHMTPADSLPYPETVKNPHRYARAEKLSAQAAALAEQPARTDMAETGSPKRYNKLAHLIKIHSWVPAFVDYDAIADMSLESVASSAGLGATLFFQNDLGTATGTLSYHAVPGSSWKHAGRLKMIYSGLYPVFELTADISSADPRQYYLQRYPSMAGFVTSLTSRPVAGYPDVSASVKTYVPLKFSSGGWQRGLVPQAQIFVSNSVVANGRAVPMNRASVSVRGYTMLPVAPSCIYPRWGIGAEAGWSGRLGFEEFFSPNAYFYTYGYVPGILREHGIRLTGTVQKSTRESLFREQYASVLPRGFAAYDDMPELLSGYPVQGRITADYAMPFASLDWGGLCPVAYVRNLEAYFHYDCSFLGGGGATTRTLSSAGVDLAVKLGNLLWVPYDTRIGVSWSYNMGLPGVNPNYFGMIFSMDI